MPRTRFVVEWAGKPGKNALEDGEQTKKSPSFARIDRPKACPTTDGFRREDGGEFMW